MQDNFIRTEPCKTVEQVFNTLATFATASAEGGTSPHPRVLFRGHRCTEWRLISKFHRQVIKSGDLAPSYQRQFAFHQKIGHITEDLASKPIRDWPSHQRKNWAFWARGLKEQELRLFAMHAMTSRQLFGVAASEASRALNMRGVQGAEIDIQTAPSVVGLAQHHGIPTQLLDWTADFHIALWHIVYDAFELFLRDGGKFSDDKHADSWSEVWGVPRCLFLGQNKVRLHVMVDQAYPTAQGGLFTLDTAFEDDFEERGMTYSLEDRLKHEGAIDSLTRFVDRPFRVQFPFRLLPQIRRRLEGNGHTVATLMPSLDNIARYVQSDDMP